MSIENKYDYQCVILAGGLATRLRPITKNIPKAMLDIEGVPFIEYQIKLLKKYGINNIILCVGYKGEMIEDYLKDGTHLGVKINYSYEETLLGTGGAIRNAIKILNEHFLVLYGDAYLNINYKTIFDYLEKVNYSALLGVYKNEGKFDTSNVLFLDDKFILYDKENPIQEMKYIDYGVSVLSRKTIEEYIPPDVFYDLADCYNELSRKKKLAGYEVKERFYEIGSFSGLNEFKTFIKAQ